MLSRVVRSQVTSRLCARSISTEIFLKGLPEISEQELKSNLEQFGNVEKMDLFKTRNVWHCQIKFEDTNAAIAAVDCLDDSVMHGRRIGAAFSTKLFTPPPKATKSYNAPSRQKDTNQDASV